MEDRVADFIDEDSFIEDVVSQTVEDTPFHLMMVKKVKLPIKMNGIISIERTNYERAN